MEHRASRADDVCLEGPLHSKTDAAARGDARGVRVAVEALAVDALEERGAGRRGLFDQPRRELGDLEDLQALGQVSFCGIPVEGESDALEARGRGLGEPVLRDAEVVLGVAAPACGQEGCWVSGRGASPGVLRSTEDAS